MSFLFPVPALRFADKPGSSHDGRICDHLPADTNKHDSTDSISHTKEHTSVAGLVLDIHLFTQSQAYPVLESHPNMIKPSIYSKSLCYESVLLRQ